MNSITDFKVGDRVVIRMANWINIWNSNHSIYAYPCDSFMNIAYSLMKNEVVGTVTHRFPPGYEMTVAFDNGQNMHMKDNWCSYVFPS